MSRARCHIQPPGATGATQEPKNGTLEPRTAAQTLILTDFPLPSVSRALSPNGRVHWGTRGRAIGHVHGRIKIAADRQGIRPVAGPVRLTWRWVFPVHRKRDLDNLSTGIVKAAQDALVLAGVIEADDSEHVVAMHTEAIVERGQRRLEIVIEPAE